MLIPDASIGRWPLTSDVEYHVSTSERFPEKACIFFLPAPPRQAREIGSLPRRSHCAVPGTPTCLQSPLQPQGTCLVWLSLLPNPLLRPHTISNSFVPDFFSFFSNTVYFGYTDTDTAWYYVTLTRCSLLDIENFKYGKVPLRAPNKAYANTLIKWLVDGEQLSKVEVIACNSIAFKRFIQSFGGLSVIFNP